MTKTMTIYLAGPVDGVTEHEARSWREWAASVVPSGVLLFDPSRAWHGASPVTAAAVDLGNRGAIYYADGVLANLSGKGRGFGTIREIEFARAHGKPVAVAIGDNEIPSLLTHDLYLALSLEDALDQLLMAIREQQDKPRPRMVLGFPMIQGDDDGEA